MSDKGDQALNEINAHERECALRYERIEERLAEGSAKFKQNQFGARQMMA